MLHRLRHRSRLVVHPLLALLLTAWLSVFCGACYAAALAAPFHPAAHQAQGHQPGHRGQMPPCHHGGHCAQGHASDVQATVPHLDTGVTLVATVPGWVMPSPRAGVMPHRALLPAVRGSGPPGPPVARYLACCVFLN